LHDERGRAIGALQHVADVTPVVESLLGGSHPPKTPTVEAWTDLVGGAGQRGARPRS
jgi:hypothetical protein